MEFKDRLRELRSEKNISTTQLASMLSKTEGAIRMWETGRSKPDMDTTAIIANYFDVSVDYLIGVSTTRNPKNKQIVADLGLSEKAINIILENKDKPLERQSNPNDNRLFSDVLSSIMESPSFVSFVYEIGWMTDPTIDKQEEIYLIDDENPIPMKAFVKLRLDNSINEMIATISKQSTKIIK